MRASRLMSLLLLLQTRGRTTAAALAAELEVSVRTIYRDVEALAEAGVPVYADRGRAGGFALVDGYRTRLTGLSDGEADALFLSGLPGPAAELGLGGAVAAAQLKLLAALSPGARDRAEAFRARFHLDVPGWFKATDRASFLTDVAAAVWNDRVVEMDYDRWEGRVRRRVAPLGLVLKGGAWYVVATPAAEGVLVAADASTVRTYRVARIQSLTVSGDEFVRPERFDLAAFWAAWSDRYERSVLHGEAVLRLSPHARALLPGWWGPIAAAAATDSATEPDASGWVTVTVPIETVDHAASQVLRFGPGAEVLAPAALRHRVAAAAAALSRVYAPGSAERGSENS